MGCDVGERPEVFGTVKGGDFLKLCGVMIFVMILAGISGCAVPGQEFSEDKTGEASWKMTKNPADDHGRHVQAVYGEGSHRLEIDGNVYISDQPVYSGTLSPVSPDSDAIETIEFWQGSFQYENLSLDEKYSSADVGILMDAQWDASQRLFADEMREKVMDIYDGLDLEMSYVNTRYYAGEDGQGTEENCVIETMALLDGFPLISTGQGDYMRSFCKIGHQGVSRMLLAGIFEMDFREQVSVISLDDVLKIVEMKAEKKEIYGYSRITGIKLAYMFDVEEEKIIFDPVWCFDTAVDDVNGDIPLFCVDACTGEIAYMSP